MADSLIFYAQELLIQASGGLAIGFGLNYLFPERGRDVSDNEILKTMVETVFQVTLTGAGALVFIGFLRGRGYDPNTTAIGLVPFWFFLLSAQPKLQSKLAGLLRAGQKKLESLETHAEKK